MPGLRGLLAELSRGVLQLVLPNTCWLCRQHLPESARSFCDACHRDLTTDLFPSCPRCGSTIGPYAPLEDGCIHCKNESFAFDGVFRMGVYDGLLREVILRLKHSGSESLAEAIATLFAERLEPALHGLGASCVVPVPLHWLRYFHRGFNQSEVLARALAAELKVPYLRLLRRIRRTPPQTGQSRTQRRENVKGAFALRKELSLEGHTVLLVDDVLTTGATAHEAAKTLKKLKPARIYACILAKPKPE